MRAVRLFFHYSFFAATCAVSLCFETVLICRLPHNSWLYGLVFGATLCSYNTHWLLGRLFLQTPAVPQSSWWRLGRGYLIVILAGFILTAWCLLHTPALLWILIPAIAGTALYSLPLLPIRRLLPLRNLGVVKTILLAATWTYVTAFLPLAAGNRPDQANTLLFLLQRFCFMLQLCLIFDLRDTRIDQEHGLHSLATDITRGWTNTIFYTSLLVCPGCSALLTYTGYAPGHFFMTTLLTAAAVFICYHMAKQQRGYWFYYLGVDGLMIISALLSFLAGI